MKPWKARQRSVSCHAFSSKFKQMCSKIGLLNKWVGLLTVGLISGD